MLSGPGVGVGAAGVLAGCGDRRPARRWRRGARWLCLGAPVFGQSPRAGTAGLRRQGKPSASCHPPELPERPAGARAGARPLRLGLRSCGRRCSGPWDRAFQNVPVSALQVNAAAKGPPPFPGAPLLSSPVGGPLLPPIRYGPPPQLCGPFGPRPLPPPFGTSEQWGLTRGACSFLSFAAMSALAL